MSDLHFFHLEGAIKIDTKSLKFGLGIIEK
jgi:hypothetical protein